VHRLLGGFTEWQKKTIQWIRQEYVRKVKVAPETWWTGRISVPGRAGADFGQSGHRRRIYLHHPGDQGYRSVSGRGGDRRAESKKEYMNETGIYVPICSDGGNRHDYHMTLALAMGADFLMLGRYFSRYDESPQRQLNGQRSLCQGVLGRMAPNRPGTGSATIWR
jgi:IMP dehydrogenase